MTDDIRFLYSSITDTQATIRATDVKSGFLFVILFMPLYSVERIYPLMVSIASQSMFLRLLIYAVVFLWIIALVLQFFCLASVSNPASHVRGAHDLGVFYGADLYKVGMNIFPSSSVVALKTLDEEIARIPSSVDAIKRELTFEKMKLAYIREVKLSRSNFAICAVFIWLSLSFICFILHIL